MLLYEDVVKRCADHPRDEENAGLHELVTGEFLQVMNKLGGVLPVSREASLAYTHIEEALHWARAAIDRNLPPCPQEPAAGQAEDPDNS